MASSRAAKAASASVCPPRTAGRLACSVGCPLPEDTRVEELPPLTPLLSGEELVLLPAGLPKSAWPCRIRAQRCRRLSSRLQRQTLPVKSKSSAHELSESKDDYCPDFVIF